MRRTKDISYYKQLFFVLTSLVFACLWLNSSLRSVRNGALLDQLQQMQAQLSEKEIMLKKQSQILIERGEQVTQIAQLHRKEQTDHMMFKQEIQNQEQEKEKNDVILTESQQKLVTDMFMQEHPNVHSMELSLGDTIEKRPPMMSKKGFWTRMELLECVLSTRVTDIPRYEVGGTHYKEGKKLCMIAGFSVFRREQVYAKLLYCLGKHRDIETILDTWINYGGASYLLAAGLLSGRKTKGYVTGYQIDLEVDRTTSKRLESYPVRSILGRTLKPYSYSPKGGVPLGNLYNLCSKKRVEIHIAHIDGKGAKYTSETGEDLDGAEYYVIRDYCQPKLIVVFDTEQPHISRFVSETKTKSKEWEIIIQGTTSGTGCHPMNKSSKNFAVFWKKQALLHDSDQQTEVK